MPEHGQLIIDTAGVQAVYHRKEELTHGMRMASGWRPWLVIDSTEDHPEDGTWRMVFTTGHKGAWISQDALIAIIVHDPEEDAG